MARYLVNRPSGGTTPEGFFKFLGFLYRYGVASGWVVSQRGSGSNMSVDVSIGAGDFLTAAAETLFGWNDAIENVVVSTANASNPRRDIVVAYADLSVVNPTNNVNALKFLSVAGTPAASPLDPSDSVIQAAVGTGNPWQKLARIAVGANATGITTGNVTSLVTPMALATPYLWGGGNNTKGHLVPNVADGTVLTSTAAGTISAQLLAFSGLVKSIPVSFSGFNSTTYTNATGAISYTPAATQHVLILCYIKYTTNTNGTGLNTRVAVDSTPATGANPAGSGNAILTSTQGTDLMLADAVLAPGAHTISLQTATQGAGTFGGNGFLLMLPMDNS